MVGHACSRGALTSGNDGRLPGTGATVAERVAWIEGGAVMLRKEER